MLSMLPLFSFWTDAKYGARTNCIPLFPLYLQPAKTTHPFNLLSVSSQFGRRQTRKQNAKKINPLANIIYTNKNDISAFCFFRDAPNAAISPTWIFSKWIKNIYLIMLNEVHLRDDSIAEDCDWKQFASTNAKNSMNCWRKICKTKGKR